MRRIPVPIGRADPGQVFLALCQGLIRWRIEPTGIAGARDWHPAECWGAVGARDAGRASRSDPDITKQKLEHRGSLAGPSTMISQVKHFRSAGCTSPDKTPAHGAKHFPSDFLRSLHAGG